MTLLTGRDPATATLHLRFLDFAIDVETNSLRLGARLEAYFAAYLATTEGDPDITLRAFDREPVYDAERMQPWSSPRPGSTRAAKESYYDEDGVRRVLKNRTGLLITLADCAPVVTGDIDANSNQVINLVGALFGIWLLDHGYVMVHASAVVDRADGRALVFLGNSGSGKSSVALQLIEQGAFDFLSNDRVLLRTDREGVSVAGLPKQPRVNPGTLLASRRLINLVPRARRRLYAELRPSELWGLEEKTDIDVERDLGAQSLLSAELGRIYALDWRPDATGLERREIAADEALAALRVTAKDFGPFDLTVRPAPDAEFARIVEAGPVIGVSGRRDPAGLARAIIEARAPKR